MVSDTQNSIATDRIIKRIDIKNVFDGISSVEFMNERIGVE